MYYKVKQMGQWIEQTSLERRNKNSQQMLEESIPDL